MKRSGSTITGFVLCVILGALDVIGLATVGMDDAPPVGVIIVGGLLGLVTLAAALPAWRGSRMGLAAVLASRVISALLAVPAFLMPDVPTVGLVIAAASIVLTAIGVGLLFPAWRAAPSGQRTAHGV